MAKIQRKDLTPDQFRRANRLTALSITIVYIIFLIMNFMSNQISTGQKIWFMATYLIYYILSAIFVYKFIRERKAMLMLAIGFELSYYLLVLTTGTQSIFMIFPVLVTITVYLNEVIFLWGCLASLVVILIKSVMLRASGTAEALDFAMINIAFFCEVVCIFGGMNAIHLLINFSNEETNAVKNLLDHQKEVSNEIGSVAETVSTEFEGVKNDLSDINNRVNNTINAIDGIAKGSEQTAHAASEQASMTAEIQNRLETTNDICNTAKQTSDELKHTISDGRTQSDELKKQSEIVNEYTTQISDTISELVQHVEKVSNITSSIMNISSQTNLLALNASIEAARAGEAGRGFAVVADEIRNLAEETKNSTSMITSIMDELTQITSKAQDAVHKSVESINLQHEKIQNVNESFSVVDTGVGELSSDVDKMYDEVATVLKANQRIVDNIDTLVAVSEEMSSNALQSASDTNMLKDNMTKFNSVIDLTSEKIATLKNISAAE